MVRVAVTYNPEVGGACVVSLKKSFVSVNCEVLDVDYRQMMNNIPKEEFAASYNTYEGRKKIFAHAKFVAEKLLNDFDCLVLSGNNAMIDPDLFNRKRLEGQTYDFSRTIAELALAHVAIQRGMPIMGSCGGHQVIAVYCGGTVKDLNYAELDRQGFLNYDVICFNVDSMLKLIIDPNSRSGFSLEQEFFGAHTQVVDEFGIGFVKTAVGSDGKLIEAAESEHGAPIITTQFHPEVTIHGLPYVEFLYKRSKPAIETSLKIFDFFAKAGETYNNKKNLMNEIKKCASKLRNVNEEAISKKELKGKQELKEEQPTKSFLSNFISYLSILMDKVKSFFRKLVAMILTFKLSRELKEQEQLSRDESSKNKNTASFSQNQGAGSTEKIIRIQMQSSNLSSKIQENDTSVDSSVKKENKSPEEIMINEPAKQWPTKKQETPNEEESVVMLLP